MTRDELLKAITGASLFPIPVEGGAEEDDVAGMLFLGDVAGFVEAATALGSRCVFVASKALEEADFLHQEEDGGFTDDQADGAPAAIDLTALQPALKEYKDRVGQHGAHRIWLQVPSVKLELLVRAPWWEAFSKLRGEAVESVKRKRESAWAEQAEQDRRREEELLKRLRSFIDDPEFVKLPTQVAMQAYAVEQAPDLEELGDKTLRAEVRALDGKIKAKGLRAKKPAQAPAAPPPKPGN
jgi:hypothetical protein